jgi:hypothetical protein
VTREHQAAYRETLIQAGGDDAGLTALYRKLADDMVYPQYHPVHARMLIDPVGRLWVEQPQTEPPWSEAIDYSAVRPSPTTWDVFSTTGVWLGSVQFPARFRVLEIGADYIAGVAKDETDVERVQVWNLDPAAPVSSFHRVSAARESESRWHGITSANTLVSRCAAFGRWPGRPRKR